MKIAVIQHHLRGDPYQDAEAMVSSVRAAQEQGAEFVILPEVDSLGEEFGGPRAEFLGALRSIDVNSLSPNASTRDEGELVSVMQLGPLGRAVLLSGDAPIDPAVHAGLAELHPDLLVMLGRSESELQAEALAEVAIGLSDSAVGLVVVVDAVGAESGKPGHGGSMIALLGEVVAEALGDDEIILADVVTPIPAPQPGEALPTVPPMLSQRLAHHRGEKPTADYPADLS